MKKLLVALIWTAVSLSLCSQTLDLSGITDLDKELYNSQVSLVDEFISRFNRTAHASQSLDFPDTKSDVAEIIGLFDLQRLQKDGLSAVNEAKDFAEQVIDSCIKIHFEDSTWFARATCHGSYGKDNTEFNLILKVVPRGQDMYRWAITGVEGELFRLKPYQTGSGFIIMPDDHETNFMSLHDMTATQPESIRLFAADSIEPDPLSVFLTMVYVGQLKIDYVSPLEFVFEQVPDWTFTIKFFDRQDFNSGWLISSLNRLESRDTVNVNEVDQNDNVIEESAIDKPV